MTKDLEKDVTEFDTKEGTDFVNIFDDFIKPGELEEEEEIVKGLKVKVKVLDIGESLAAEAILSYEAKLPADIVARVRSASILSRAIISLNGVPITTEKMTDEERHLRRNALYKKLQKMPPMIVQKMYNLYMKAFQKQNEIYGDFPKMVDDIKNF